MPYTIGLDYGTNSVRCLIVDTTDGRELGTCVYEYETGEAGIILDPADHNLARQNPADYLKGAEVTVAGAIAEARRAEAGFDPKDIVGIGVDTTGSTPIPVDRRGTPLAMKPRFKNNLAAHARLWKDHTGHAEAAEITEWARKSRVPYLSKCGGTYSSEWYWSKLLHCRRTSPKVFRAAYAWVELADFVPAFLTSNLDPDTLPRGICAAGHKAMYHDQWGGLPKKEFLRRLDPALAAVRDHYAPVAVPADRKAGKLTAEVAKKIGLPPATSHTVMPCPAPATLRPSAEKLTRQNVPRTPWSLWTRSIRDALRSSTNLEVPTASRRPSRE